MGTSVCINFLAIPQSTHCEDTSSYTQLTAKYRTITTMPHSKTPGGQAASDKFLKRDAETHGLGAENAPGHKEQSAPGERLAASGSYTSTVGIDNKATNVPGEKGNLGATVERKRIQISTKEIRNSSVVVGGVNNQW